jgi:enolase-phosphatase E1
MAFNLSSLSIKAILLDIEGTTTPIDFVTETLFPFARAHVKDYLREHCQAADVIADLARLRTEYEADINNGLSPPLWQEPADSANLEGAVKYIFWLMDQDRNSTGLKSLQGKIWQQGYQQGSLRAKLFDDVVPALAQWQDKNIGVYIFSSGSVLAQKLLFGHSEAGDLLKYFQGFFDTVTGAKNLSLSYQKIAAVIALPADHILFISDVVMELDAAREIGMKTLLSLRPGNRPQPAHNHPTIESFLEIGI